MQHCFYSSSNGTFDSPSQEDLKVDQMNCHSNLYWPQFTPPDYYNYAYHGLQPQWIGEDKYPISTQPQWESNQEIVPLCNTATPPSFPQTSEHPPLPDSDLEIFAEHFKQRRMKMGITQADVGKALGEMMIPGVESLSQSTICRFESLTLSRSNMIALRPLLQIWLDRTEALGAANSNSQAHDSGFFSPISLSRGNPNRRKRTCITDSEKRALEAYFAVQPQPSSDRISQIGKLLSLPKSVVRVWFCNQRQKQKRLKWGYESVTRVKGAAESKIDVEYFSR
ncbi:unnamed protein product [Hymenolepis diminuta]|uniref:POU domain protein n=2 Tax=Hymenolepis diminuta TaxID=6216 RepID=A0A0R3SBU9_HYMDI|nr:unnamed protein product [Hymenolepis diminuta]